MPLSATARETDEMNQVALLTPTYGRDLELCTLLCESVDRHVSSFAKHYLLVPDCDLPLFAHFESARRSVLPASKFLPNWLRPLPRIVQRKRRQYWWSFRTKPVSGWHVQQFLKIAATISLPHQRYCILDSDIVFFRDFDLSRFECPESDSAADHARRGHIRAASTIRTGSRPAIGFWDCRRRRFRRPISSATSFSGTRRRRARWPRDRSRHRSRLGRGAVPDARAFRNTCCTAISSENEARFSAQHTLTSHTPCVSYWDQPQARPGRIERAASRRRSRTTSPSRWRPSPGRRLPTIRAAIEEAASLASLPLPPRKPRGSPRHADRTSQHQSVAPISSRHCWGCSACSSSRGCFRRMTTAPICSASASPPSSASSWSAGSAT